MFSLKRDRKATVVVGVEASVELILKKMVFQGTVFAPPLRNLFYEDASAAIHEMNFEERAYSPTT